MQVKLLFLVIPGSQPMNTVFSDRHHHCAVTCGQEIDWEKGKIIGKEKGWTQRKYLEGIESLRRKNQGIEPLNNYNQLEQWQPVLFPLFERQNLYMSSPDGMCK